MDKKVANQIVNDTFNAAFKKEAFIYFIKNLLNHIEEAPFVYRGNFIPDAYNKHIDTLERIGKYTDGENEIDILIVNLKKETSIERARAMQRNFIAWYLNGSRGGELKDASLVAFVSPNQKDWRFSLVKMDYKFEETKDGRKKVKEIFTPARRWSFLVGENENSHTAKSRLAPIVCDDEHNPTLKELEDAFNIEKVTKEFFEKYRELFLWAKESFDKMLKEESGIRKDFEAKGVNTVDFTKKLLGQIVFLYFLQKKGWFGVERDANWGTGPKNFLRELFEAKRSKYKNFFNDILEPLFYEALAREREDSFYSRFNCKIPFLNGGLFDPINNYDWVHTDINLPNELFSNEYKTKEGDIGNGILDTFDRYNFTVKEDEPLEKEVAIDPEMLGKVFENLLEVKDRKSKGTYYTPREIVHYMCEQSLLNYLSTELEGKVRKVEVENLIKYGESVIENEIHIEAKGKETKKYNYKLPESIRKNAKLIDNKLADIKVCDPAVGSGAFPVGMMAEIIKARSVLSAYIKNKNRTTYNFKRQCIQNSLYGVDIDLGAVEIAKLRLWLSLIVDEEDIKTIKPLPNLDYKIVCGNSLMSIEKNLFNQQLFVKLEELKPLFFDETNTDKKREYKKQIDEIIKKITNGHKDFDFEIYFSEVFHEKKGFDVVIANPPWVFSRLGGFTISEKKYYSKRYVGANGKINLYSLFVNQGFMIIKNKGFVTMIIPNTFLRASVYEDLRRYLLSKTKIISIADTGANVFGGVTASTIVFILSKDLPENNIQIVKFSENINPFIFENISIKDILNSEAGVINIYAGNYEQTIKIKIWSKAHPLSNFKKNLISGIQTWKQNKNKFIFNRPITNEYKPLIEGKDIDSYRVNFNNKYIFYNKKALNVMQDENIFLHSEKIVIQRVGGGNRPIKAAIDKNRYYCFNSLNTLICKNIDHLFVLALLNSKILNWYYSNFFSNRSSLTVNISTGLLEQLPIAKIESGIDEKNKNKIIKLVNKILDITKLSDYLVNSEKQANVKEYEYQIDQIVYKLYNLTPEEIKVVESSIKN